MKRARQCFVGKGHRYGEIVFFTWNCYKGKWSIEKTRKDIENVTSLKSEYRTPMSYSCSADNHWIVKSAKHEVTENQSQMVFMLCILGVGYQALLSGEKKQELLFNKCEEGTREQTVAIICYRGCCFIHTPICVAYCLLSTFPEFCDKNPQAYYAGGIGTHNLGHSRADVLPLDRWDCLVASGSLNPIQMQWVLHLLKIIMAGCPFLLTQHASLLGKFSNWAAR